MLYVMKYDRIEVRLDEERVRKLSELRASYHTSTSQVVRRAIDTAYKELDLKSRLDALERIKAFPGVEEMPDPEELKRQNEEFYSRAIEESLKRCEAEYEPPGPD
jgi:Arc/MetJ-type ribon-helix-helix transcriptional regulator